MIKVLIVDNQQLLLDLMKNMLDNNADIDVVGCAMDGAGAIEMVEEYHPDEVIIDINIPNCNGIECIRRIKEINNTIKILVLTSSCIEKDVNGSLHNGADGYVLKSISGEELILAIKSVHANMHVIHNNVRQMPVSIQKVSSIDSKKMVMVEDFRVELSDREIDIIKMIVEGKCNSEMASSLFVSEGRIRNIITVIISKLMLKDRTEVAVFALKNKLV